MYVRPTASTASTESLTQRRKERKEKQGGRGCIPPSVFFASFAPLREAFLRESSIAGAEVHGNAFLDQLGFFFIVVFKSLQQALGPFAEDAEIGYIARFGSHG